MSNKRTVAGTTRTQHALVHGGFFFLQQELEPGKPIPRCFLPTILAEHNITDYFIGLEAKKMLTQW
uniref:Uncharacterized protein n=1 Tax=Arundo donax TaxID=35708 RepID=A0A0A9GT82_ARUDO